MFNIRYAPHNRVDNVESDSHWDRYISFDLSMHLGNTMPEGPNILITKILPERKSPFHTFILPGPQNVGKATLKKALSDKGLGKLKTLLSVIQCLARGKKNKD